MKYWLIFYGIGCVLSVVGLIKRMMRAQLEITVQELFYTFLFSLVSWVGYILFDEDFGDFMLTLSQRFTNIGSKVIWRKKNDRPVPGPNKVAVQLPPSSSDV